MASGDTRRSKKRAVFFYGLYSVLVLFFLLYLRFPSDALRIYVESVFANDFQPLTLHVGSVSLDLPPGLLLREVSLMRPGAEGGVLFRAENLQVRLEALRLLRGTISAGIRCEAYGGAISGTVQFPDRRFKGPVEANLVLEGIRLDRNPGLQKMLDRRVQGVLEGTVSFRGLPEDPLAGEGEMGRVARSGSIEITQPLLGLDVLDFSRAVFNLELRNRRFNLNVGDMEGPDFRGTLTGTIIPSAGLEESRINLRGSVEPFSSFFSRKGGQNVLNLVRQRLKQGKLNFTVQGTLSRPLVDLI